MTRSSNLSTYICAVTPHSSDERPASGPSVITSAAVPAATQSMACPQDMGSLDVPVNEPTVRRMWKERMDSQTIEATAARWLLKREGTSLTESEQIELDSWLNESTLHRVAFIRLQAVWRQMARLKVFGARAPKV